MPVITEIEDLKRLYKRRAPKMFYDYCESGSYRADLPREHLGLSTSSGCARRWPWT
jgi:L-lactate dehydrogenase (cytochrome)